MQDDNENANEVEVPGLPGDGNKLVAALHDILNQPEGNQDIPVPDEEFEAQDDFQPIPPIPVDDEADEEHLLKAVKDSLYGYGVIDVNGNVVPNKDNIQAPEEVMPGIPEENYIVRYENVIEDNSLFQFVVFIKNNKLVSSVPNCKFVVPSQSQVDKFGAVTPKEWPFDKVMPGNMCLCPSMKSMDNPNPACGYATNGLQVKCDFYQPEKINRIQRVFDKMTKSTYYLTEYTTSYFSKRIAVCKQIETIDGQPLFEVVNEDANFEQKREQIVATWNEICESYDEAPEDVTEELTKPYYKKVLVQANA